MAQNRGPNRCFPIHKLILTARSKVFRDIFDSDDCKASTITLAEMTHDELEVFLEFMYSGSLPDTKLKQHGRTLYLAADKYEIPYLQDLGRKQLIASMNSSNALDVLELAEIPSDKILKDAISEFIIAHMEEISPSSKFMSFVESNPALMSTKSRMIEIELALPLLLAIQPQHPDLLDFWQFTIRS